LLDVKVKCKVIPMRQHWSKLLSTQPDTSLHCQTMDCVVWHICLSYSLFYPKISSEVIFLMDSKILEHTTRICSSVGIC